MNAPEVGFLDSLAWRVDDQLHVTLHLPDVAVADQVEVRFRDADRRVRMAGRITAAAAGGALVEVDVPARRLAGGLWRIAVRVGDAETFTRVEARLLVRRGQPVALLPGPEPRSRMAEPPARQAPSAAAGAASVSGRVLRGLRRRLPGDHATS